MVDRIGKRFDSEEPQASEEREERTESTESEGSDSSGEAQSSKNPMQADNVKTAWNATSVYLPEFLDTRLGRQYKHLDLDFEEHTGESLQKTRHYYPLVIREGLEALESMEPREINERIEALERTARQEE